MLWTLEIVSGMGNESQQVACMSLLFLQFFVAFLIDSYLPAPLYQLFGHLAQGASLL